jgi:hypothetical protein
MEEVDATILDGDTVLISGVAVLLDMPDTPEDSSWHAHAALPVGLLLEPHEQMRLQTTDGRSGVIEIFETPTVEGDRILYVFEGIGPLTRAGAS